MLESTIDGLRELLLAAADAEFRTAMGLANFVLTIAVFVTHTLRALGIRAWNLLMWLLNIWIGSAPERPQPVPQLPSLPVTLAYTLGAFCLCVATVSAIN